MTFSKLHTSYLSLRNIRHLILYIKRKNITGRLDFDPNDGTNLAYPHKNTVKLLNTTTWAEITLTCSEISADFSILQYSFCGIYLAAATLEGDFVIWETGNRKVYKVTKHESSKAICGLMWNPKGNVINNTK